MKKSEWVAYDRLAYKLGQRKVEYSAATKEKLEDTILLNGKMPTRFVIVKEATHGR